MARSEFVSRRTSSRMHADSVHQLFQERFTVKDVLRMLKAGSQRGSDSGESNKSVARMMNLLPEMRSAQIFADLNMAEELKKATKVAPKSSSEILVKASDSDTLNNTFALCDRVLEEEEVLVDPEVTDTYLRRLKLKALANSSFKKPPKPRPPPGETWEEKMQAKTMKVYYRIYGPDKPRPNYPILPPRERPVVIPEEPKKKKGKKGKGKKKKGKKVPAPPEPFDMTQWRVENLPVASTKLFYSWFDPLPCYQQTPNFSNPPTPPAGLPEPVSQFGYFIGCLPQVQRDRFGRVKHYKPYSSLARALAGASGYQPAPPVSKPHSPTASRAHTPMPSPGGSPSSSIGSLKPHPPDNRSHSFSLHLPGTSANAV